MTRHPGRNAALLSAAIALLGCATGQGFDRRMGAYVGRPEADLVAALGVPVRTYASGSRRFLQYERRRVTADALPGWGWRGGGVDVQTWDCSVTFEVEGGRVEGFTSRGNDCVAPNPS